MKYRCPQLQASRVSSICHSVKYQLEYQYLAHSNIDHFTKQGHNDKGKIWIYHFFFSLWCLAKGYCKHDPNQYMKLNTHKQLYWTIIKPQVHTKNIYTIIEFCFLWCLQIFLKIYTTMFYKVEQDIPKVGSKGLSGKHL